MDPFRPHEVTMPQPPTEAPAFASLPVSSPGARSAKGAFTGSVSLLLHALALGAVLVVPLLSDESLPERADRVQAFFAAPLELTPPPPPPPPPAAPRPAPRAEAPREAPVSGFLAPVEVPTGILPEQGLDLSFEGGLPGGVEGGVPGGVLGGIVGGLPEAPPPPRVDPLRAGLDVREPRRLKHVAPIYPGMAVASRLEGVVVVECLIDTRGRVQQTRVLRSVPLLDEAALDAVRQWTYTPTLLNGEPVPVVMTVTVTFRLR